jgi:hypothetical protein
MTTSSTPAAVDHLVVAAASLEDGVHWCEATLGVTPDAGGKHALFGTHNRLLRIATSDFAQAYLEIIAIDAAAQTPQRAGARWFDMDDPALQQSLRSGPRLVHFVAATSQVDQDVIAWRALGLDRGRALQAQRETPRGLLQWHISVRDDGQRLMDGTLPTLIQWGAVHPSQSLPDRGVRLLDLSVRHPQHQLLEAAYAAIGLRGIAVHGVHGVQGGDASAGAADLVATLLTPRGVVTLRSRSAAGL